jgi:hypothetical protein
MRAFSILENSEGPKELKNEGNGAGHRQGGDRKSSGRPSAQLEFPTAGPN